MFDIDQDQVKKCIVILILFLIIDTVWLKFVAGPKYTKSIAEIQGEPLVANYKMAILVYFAMTILLLLCVNKNFSTKELFLVGFTSYFIYDFTNASIFKKWDKMFGLYDSLWGGFLFAIVGYIIKNYI